MDVILTSMRIKDFLSVEWSMSLGVIIGKGKTQNLSYILDLASRLLLDITRGLGRERRQNTLEFYRLGQPQEC